MISTDPCPHATPSWAGGIRVCGKCMLARRDAALESEPLTPPTCTFCNRPFGAGWQWCCPPCDEKIAKAIVAFVLRQHTKVRAEFGERNPIAAIDNGEISKEALCVFLTEYADCFSAGFTARMLRDIALAVFDGETVAGWLAEHDDAATERIFPSVAYAKSEGRSVVVYPDTPNAAMRAAVEVCLKS